MGTSESNTAGTLRNRFTETLLGLQFRATCGVVSLTFAMVALVCWLFVAMTANLTGRLQRHQCTQLSAMLAHAAAGAMERGDAHALQTLGHQFTSPDSLLFVVFFDTAGKVVATADRDTAHLRQPLGQGLAVVGDQALGTPEFIPSSASGPAYLEVTYPINKLRSVEGTDEQGEAIAPQKRMDLLGYVRLGLSVEHSLQEESTSIDLVTGTAILVGIVTVPLGFIIVRRVVEPIEELSAVTGEFAAGNLGVRSRVRRRDEIGKLAAAFNRMANLHEQNHNQLVALNVELEERVNRRTRQLRELASRDPLTGLYNRRHFNEVLGHRLAEARRYQTPLSCLMLDLDDFKNANDTHGHQVGDELLMLTALTITSQLRAADVAARFGGDEFVVLLPQTSCSRARTLSERIAEKLTADVHAQLPQVKLTLSIGIGSLQGIDSDDPDELVRAADRALYAAKSEGKNRIATATA
ncbi:MAG: diguanylate cyclase [Phycisphaerae bacterium]|nr:diguanylate cyclase [Phycisphaerae bacterium]